MYSEGPHIIKEQCSINALNVLLRGEIAAVEAYQHAIPHFHDKRKLALEGNLYCHGLRIHALTTRIYEIGGAPIQGSGAWGTFTRFIESGAALFGNDLLLSTLEEGEQHGMLQYNSYKYDLDPVSRRLVTAEIVPAQSRTYQAIVDLRKNVLSTPSPSRRCGLLMGLLFSASILAGCGNEREERDVKLAELSPSARITVNTIVGDGEILSLKEGRQDGRLCYSVTIKRENKSSAYVVDEIGLLLN